jgi:spore maturation protein CgeB
MRILIFGLTVSSSWGNGHATLWRGLCNALTEAGHSITFFERNVPYYHMHRDLAQPQGYALQFYCDWDDIRAKAEDALSDSDCAIVTSYCPDACAASDLMLANPKVFSIFYDLDTPVTLNALDRQEKVDYVPSYGLEPFDLVLSYTGGKALCQLQTQLHAKRVAPLYGSVDPATHHRVDTDMRFASDFSYLGTYASDRQHQLQELFLKPANQLPQKKFCIGGAMYPPEFPWTSNTYFVRHVAPPEHPAFYSSSKLTLNVTRAAMAEMGYCPSGRLFEAAACGTPIVSDWWEGMDDFFQPDKEILIAGSCEDAVGILNFDCRELDAIAHASQERTLAEHTAAHRAAELISMIEATT